MRNLFKVKKLYIIKHKILEVLYKDWETTRKEGRKVGSIRIANETEIPIAEINRWHQPLIGEDEISTSDNAGQYMMTIGSVGRVSYIEEKYLKLGRKEMWEDIWDRARIILPLISILISIYLIVVNSELKTRIQKLEIKTQNIK